MNVNGMVTQYKSVVVKATIGEPSEQGISVVTELDRVISQLVTEGWELFSITPLDLSRKIEQGNVTTSFLIIFKMIQS
jgi:hypothetical protein